jgi:hypothetical protein
MTEKFKLTGGPDQAVTWIWLEDGLLKVEYYDFSQEAHTFFGNDIAWTITVHDMNKLYSTVNKDEASLIAWMERCFKSYFDIKHWLEENGIDFNIERESWA